MIRSGRGVLPFARCYPQQARLTRAGTSWSCHPAASAAARSYNTSLHLKLPSTNPTVPSRYPSKRISNPFLRPVRHCSHRRALNMCKHFGHEADATSSIDVTKGREVLPKNVKPVHYDLTLEPKLDGDFTYEGTVVIDLDVVEDTNSISLNTLDLKLHSTTVKSGDTVITSKPDVSYNEDTQTTKVSFKDTIPAGGKAQLVQTFTGVLNNNMAGFYRSSYNAADGSTKYLATTQMEPTDARRAFPCFDEPALKSEFTITLVADKHLTCLSNMDAVSEKEVDSKIGGGKKTAVTFRKTPLMSTYLLAFIVGELNVIETNDFRVPVRVFATPDKDINHGKFSLDLAAKTLDFYEKKFDSKFPLPKMDMVAIPDFSAGAMENWGLVTYRVVDLLFDEKISGASTKQRVAEVVQHELAHQWFGNLVTMDFWDGLWLNEGFATWMSWYSCNAFYPEWKVWQGYVTDNLQSALSLDSLRSSHPIEVPVKRADEINQIFDAISYSKGSCVLRMISKYLGEETFMEGIRRYLKKHAYGNTQTSDLWAALSDASGKDVEKVMDIWTKNVGFPVVTVTEKPESGSIHVKQNRFLRTADVKPEEDKILYPVFLGLRTQEGINEELTLTSREADFKLNNTDFFKINADHSGIYRTSYTPERLQKLGEAAKKGLLSVEDRAGMIADAGALAASGYQKTSGLLSLLEGFKAEPEFVVWDELTARVGSLRSAWIFEDEAVKDSLKKFQLKLIEGKAHELGWEFKDSDGHIEQQFKSLLFGAAGIAGDEAVKKAAFDMFEKFKSGDKTAIHPNIRASVYGIVLTYGGAEEYDAVLKEYRTASTSDERNTALRAIGRARSPELIQRTLALPLSDEVKGQDIYLPLGGLRTHKDGIEALWKWMTEHWDELEKKLPPGLTMLGTVVSICTSSFTRKEHIQRIEDFFGKRSTKGFDQSLAQSLDAIRAKSNWITRDSSDVEAFLKEHGYL
ncbi:Aminopeptidase 2, mitochondrial [Diplodia seriata]|uniref:Aminopeptidase n=1 Tax=Diplodia seriata TaxID=420778 RepID=A0A1S8B9T3_9PEZI|nr:Aminopeptidase 2, mitochondrial [Diplodia seriata]